jgi:hypothetical protein
MSRALLALPLLLATIASADDIEGRLATGEPKLKHDEGLLLLVTDGDQAIKRLRFVRETGGAVLETETAPNDQVVNAYRLPEGRYRLELIESAGGRTANFKADDPVTLRVDVVAGAINYPGDLQMKVREDGVKLRTDGNYLDLLPELMKEPRRLYPTMLDALPFVVCGPLRIALEPQLKAPPQPAWKYDDWIANLALPTRAEQLAVMNQILAKSDLAAVTLGMTRKQVDEALAKLPQEDGRLFASPRGAEIVVLSGFFGDDGDVVAAMLYYDEDDALRRVALRTIDGWAVWSVPSPDAWLDIKGYADAPQP